MVPHTIQTTESLVYASFCNEMTTFVFCFAFMYSQNFTHHLLLLHLAMVPKSAPVPPFFAQLMMNIMNILLNTQV